VDTLECATADLDTATGNGVELLARTTGGGAAFREGAKQVATQEAGPAINAAGAGYCEQVCGVRFGDPLRSAAADLWKGFGVADAPRVGGYDLTGANELTGTACFGFDTPQAAGIEDCAGWATHYWVERK
jgi:hypothetical protein